MELHDIRRAAIYTADSSTFTENIPDHSVDLILTDPPYNLGTYSTGNIKMDWRADFNNDIAAWDTDHFDPQEWRDTILRILKPTGNFVAFTSYNQLGDWHRALDPVFDTFQFMVWHKTNPAPKLRRAGFLNSCELIVFAWNKGHTWNFGKQNEMHNFIETPICMGSERVTAPKHPTQKPLSVLRHILKIASNPGDIVLDPFMGVGSTGVAALEMGRRFIGIDKELPYVKAAKTRIESTLGDPMITLIGSTAKGWIADPIIIIDTVTVRKRPTPRRKSRIAA